MTSSNEVILAAAGSGKTRRLIVEAVNDPGERVLVTTYTRENMEEIRRRLWSASNGVPHAVSTKTWFEFLLQDAIKPYQSYKTDILRVQSIDFVTAKPMYKRKEDFESYYLDSANNVYSDTASDLACVLNDVSGGKVVHRLEQLYDAILIDEMQDLAGWDLNFVELLLKSRLRVLLVGDPRQAVYSTNRSNKNSQYKNAGVVDWIDKLIHAGLCTRSELAVSYRCSQAICDFADALFPTLPSTRSAHHSSTMSSGVHLVKPYDVARYEEIFHPQSLRWDRRNKAAGPNALNFGDVKGREFSRVLVHPTGAIRKYLECGESLEGVALTKFYVAITRASDSVGIVTDKAAANQSLNFWSPGSIGLGSAT